MHYPEIDSLTFRGQLAIESFLYAFPRRADVQDDIRAHSPPPPRTICGSVNVLIPSSTPRCFPIVRKGRNCEAPIHVSGSRSAARPVTRGACRAGGEVIMGQTQPDSATKLKNSRTDRATAKAELQAVRKKSKRIEKTLETLEAEKRQIEEFMGKSAAQWTVFGFHRGLRAEGEHVVPQDTPAQTRRSGFQQQRGKKTRKTNRRHSRRDLMNFVPDRQRRQFGRTPFLVGRPL